MTARLWVLIIVLVVCLVAASLYIGWHRAGVGGRVERQFRARLEHLSGARVELDEFRLGLGYVEIEGLRLRDREERYVLTAERLRLSLSLFDQFLGSMGLDADIREIFANRPRVEVDLDRLREVPQPDGGDLSAMTGFLPQRITISKGSIVFASSRRERASRITQLDGWLEEDQQGAGTFRCRGSWGADGGNLIVSGTYQDHMKGYQIQGELRQARLSEVLAPVLPSRYSYHRGRLMMTLRAARKGSDDRTHIDGSLIMEAGRLVDEKIGITLRDVKTRARLEGMDVILEGAEANALGGTARAQGRITDLLHPATDLWISLQDIDIEALQEELLGSRAKPGLCGCASLEGRLTGSTDDLAFQGRISAPALQISGHTLTDLRGTVANRGSHVRIDELTARLDWAQVGCRGELDLSSSPPGVLIDWRLEDMDLAAALKGSSVSELDGRGFMAGRVAGTVPDVQFQGGFQLQEVAAPWMPVDALVGCFHWDGQRLSYRVTAPDGSIRLEGGADGLSLRARQEAILCLDRVPAGGLIADLTGQYGVSTIGGRWIISLTPVSLTSVGQLTVEAPGRSRGRFRTSVSIRQPWEPGRRVEVKVAGEDLVIAGMPAVMSLHIAIDPDDLWIRELTAGEELKACARIGLNGAHDLDGSLIFSGLRLRSSAVLVMPSVGQRAPQGTLWGGLRIGGSWRDPLVEGRVRIEDGRIGRLRDLMAAMSLRFQQGRLWLDRTDLFSAGHRLLTLEGFIEDSERWQLLACGWGVQADRLAALVENSIDRAEGTLQAVCRLQGPLTSPRLQTLLRWDAGRLNEFGFDRLHAELRKEPDRWHLDRFTVDSWDRQSIHASGTGPGDLFGFLPGKVPEQSPELDVSIGAEGEIVSLLPPLTGLIEDAGGRGEIHLRLGGLPGALVIGSGHCRLYDAWIEPAVFIDRIENLHGRVEIDADDRFVSIEHLSGTVGDRPLMIGNRRASPGGGPQAITIPGLGLDVGIITMETGRDGIEVNVPSLMARGAAGQMRFTSFDQTGPLLISGPLESPTVTGSLVLDHLEFTYPRIATSGKASLSFLSHVNWDLLVEANNDVWYRNDYALLRLREDVSRLHFAGSTDEKTLKVVGHAEADRGEITYLDRPFEVKEFEMDFEGQTKPSSSQTDNRPFVSGRFETTIYDDSTGVATEIYLTLYTTDPQTGERLSRGQWGDFELELSSNDPSDDDRQKILAKLGYSGDYSEKALQLLQVTLGPKLNEVFLRPVIQPVERTIKRALGIDVVRLQPGLTWNLLSQEESPPGAYRSLSRRLVFPRTTLLVGKYLTDNCFLSYLGKFQTRTDEFLDDRLGISHRFGLEYRLSGGTVLDIEYDYERDLTEGDKRVKATSDKRIQITHNFPF